MTSSPVVLLPGLLSAEPPANGRAAFSDCEPPQLQFSDARGIGPDEERESQLAATLARADPAARLAAARELWRGHSRTHSRAVLTFAYWSGRKDDDFRSLRREVDGDLNPSTILRGLREGDYRWAAWRAGLRPHKDLVPVLLDALKDRPDYHSETILALGQSRDERALKTLVALLKGGDYRDAGDAAQALGLLGDPRAEPALIEALSAGAGWARVHSCIALAEVGTPAAVPALERLAKSDEYTGALAIKQMAQLALDRIAERTKP
jgi:hypothetical protein